MAFRILVIAPTSFFSDYGAHVRILEEISHLQERGHSILVCTYHTGGDVPGVPIHRSIDVPWKRGVMVGSSRHKLYFDVGLAATVQRAALEFKPDLVHAHLHEGALLGWPVRMLHKVPLIFDYQGSLTAEMQDHHFLRPESPFFRPLKWLERRIDRSADAVIVSSRNAEHRLRLSIRDYTDRITTVIDAVNTQVFAPPGSGLERNALLALKHSLGIPGERKVVAYLGLLAPYQGTDLLLEAASIMLNEWGRHDIHFLLMGFPGVDSYRAQADKLGLNGYVSFPGRISYSSAPRFLAVGDVAVAPKISSTEGAGKIGNYMAMALPVVTFDTAVSREYLNDLGVYASPGDSRSLAERLRQVLDNPERYREVGTQLRERCIEDLSWRGATDSIENIYKRAISARLQIDPLNNRALPEAAQVGISSSPTMRAPVAATPRPRSAVK
ncbi:MAG: glycosyltransferase family 4 protein [Chloroflexota bacterium]|nr:glycosyltransferase family 4 protein [Chloroflexota bacterium]